MKTLSVETKNDILVVNFDNPVQANCFGQNEAEQLNKILNTKTKGLIFQAANNKIFCSGGNLTDYAKLKTKSAGQKINKQITQTLKKLSQSNYPTICLVTGDCLGGGVELISAFDKALATPNCFFGLWQRKMGLSFGWDGFERLQYRVHPQTLKQLALETRLVSSFEAKQINLIDEVLPKALLLSKAIEWIERQSHLPPTPVAKIKNLSTKNESAVFDSLWMGKDHQEILKKLKR